VLRTSRYVTPALQPNYEVVRPPLAADFAVVVPGLNPGPALDSLIEDLRSTFAREKVVLQIIVVDDGSSPALAPIEVSSVALLRGPNQGKGAAIRAGLAVAQAPVVGFIDSDGAYSASALLGLYRCVSHGTVTSAVGGRRRAVGLRGLTSIIFSLWVRLWLGIKYDTQAGIKVFSADLISRVTPYVESTGFALDVDLLYTAKRLGFSSPAVIRVTPAPTALSTVNIKRSLTALYEVAHLRLKAPRRANSR
jgi:glycosyltransferase involved in cell wall biosynthesis